MTFQGTEPGRPFFDHVPPIFKQGVYDAAANETHYFDYEDRITFAVTPSGAIFILDADEDTGLVFDLLIKPQPVPGVFANPSHTASSLIAYRLARAAKKALPLFKPPPKKTAPKVPKPKLPPVGGGSWDDLGKTDIEDPWWLDGSRDPSGRGPFSGVPGGPGGRDWLAGLGGRGSNGSDSTPFTPTGTPTTGSTGGGTGTPGDQRPTGWVDILGNLVGDGAGPGDGPQAGPYQGAGSQRGEGDGSSAGSSSGTSGDIGVSYVNGKKVGEWNAGAGTYSDLDPTRQQNPAPGTRQGLPDPTRDPVGLTGIGLIDAAIIRNALFQAGFMPARLGPSRALTPDAGVGRGVDVSGFDPGILDPLAPVISPDGDYEGGRRRYPPVAYQPGVMGSPYIEALYPDGAPGRYEPPPADPGAPMPDEGGDPHAGGGAVLVAYSAGVTSPTIEFDAAGRVRRVTR